MYNYIFFNLEKLNDKNDDKMLINFEFFYTILIILRENCLFVEFLNFFLIFHDYH